MKQHLIIFNLALLAGFPAAAQQRVSPEIYPDRTVTFQFNASNATNVMLTLEAAVSQPMIKDEGGAWREPEFFH
jgi:hypothetical protein